MAKQKPVQLRPIPRAAQIPDTINDICYAYRQSLAQQSFEKLCPAETHSQALDGVRRLLWKRWGTTEGSEGHRPPQEDKSQPTRTPGSSQKLNHQPRAHSGWNEALGYMCRRAAHSPWLPCLAPVGEHEPNPTGLDVPDWGIPMGEPYPLIGEGEGGGGRNLGGGSTWDVS